MERKLDETTSADDKPDALRTNRLLVGTRFSSASLGDVPFAVPFQPITGLLIGFFASAIPFFCMKEIPFASSSLMLTSGLYVFLLAWLNGFVNLQGLGRACAALSCRNRSLETRRDVLSGRRLAGVFIAAGCVSTQLCLKFLASYLLFARMLLLSDGPTATWLVLCLTPCLARIAMLDLLPGAWNGLKSERLPTIPVEIAWMWKIVGFLLCVAVFLFCQIAPEPFSLQTFTAALAAEAARQDPVLLWHSVFAAIPPCAATLIVSFYWKRQTIRHLDSRGGTSAPKAVCECAETAALCGFLIATELFFY